MPFFTYSQHPLLSRTIKIKNCTFAVVKSTTFFVVRSLLFPTRSLLTFSQAYRSISCNHCLTLLKDSWCAKEQHHQIGVWWIIQNHDLRLIWLMQYYKFISSNALWFTQANRIIIIIIIINAKKELGVHEFHVNYFFIEN